jgi:GTP pyrophosphokinase
MDYAATLLSKFPGTSPRRSRDIKALTETLESYMPAELIERIMKAYEFGAIAHEGQTRISGEPYISHPVAVAQTLADMHLDSQTIVAAILHDVVEDTDIAIAELEDQFGTEVATLVDAVSKLDQMHFTNRAEAQAESFRKMMLAMSPVKHWKSMHRLLIGLASIT